MSEEKLKFNVLEFSDEQKIKFADQFLQSFYENIWSSEIGSRAPMLSEKGNILSIGHWETKHGEAPLFIFMNDNCEEAAFSAKDLHEASIQIRCTGDDNDQEWDQYMEKYQKACIALLEEAIELFKTGILFKDWRQNK